MPDWERDSDQLRSNLVGVLRDIRDRARTRDALTITAARDWHTQAMAGLAMPDTKWVGAFRGEPGLERCEVVVGRFPGVASEQITSELEGFETRLQQVVRRLDELIPNGAELSGDTAAAVVDLAAWAHAEWVRIHPFANGNGRIARLWANAIAMRYGLPPFVRLRPRPDGRYENAAMRAMQGDWQATSAVFLRMLHRFCSEDVPL